jgi:hypothetical protein
VGEGLGCVLKATLNPARKDNQGVDKQPPYWDRSEAYNGMPLVCAVERPQTVSQKGAGKAKLIGLGFRFHQKKAFKRSAFCAQADCVRPDR